MREYWLVHPLDRIVTIHRRGSEGGFGAPELHEARGSLESEGFPGLTIDWDDAFAGVPPAE